MSPMGQILFLAVDDCCSLPNGTFEMVGPTAPMSLAGPN